LYSQLTSSDERPVGINVTAVLISERVSARQYSKRKIVVKQKGERGERSPPLTSDAAAGSNSRRTHS